MTNFVTDLTDLPFPKTDETPLGSETDPTQAVSAADWNPVCQALLDLRGYALASSSSGQGDPNGLLEGAIGDLYRDTSNGQLFINTTGSSVWVAFSRADGGSTPPATLFVGVGDSNQVGQGRVDDIPWSGLAVPFPSVTYTRRWSGAALEPPTYLDLAAGAIRPYATGSNPSMGAELSFAPTLYAAGVTARFDLLAISGTTLAQWKPTSTYPLAANLFTQFVARTHALEAATDRKLGGLLVHLGTNDATSSPDATAFQANMVAFCTAVWSAFGNQVLILWVKTNVNTTSAFTSTVRAGQVLAAATDPRILLIENDDCTLASDLIHFTAGEQITIGEGAAFRWLDAKGYQRIIVGTVPLVVGRGSPSFGAGALAPRPWRGTQAVDRLYLLVVTGQTNTAITTPSGWTLVANTAQSAVASGSTSMLAVYEHLVTQAELDANSGRAAPIVVVDSASTLNAAQVFTVRGQSTTGPVTDIASGSFSNTLNTGPNTITGVTTTGGSRLVMVFAGGFSQGLNSTTIAMAGLSSLTEIYDAYHTIGSDQLFMNLTIGVKAAVGATGSGTLTATANTIPAFAVVAVKTS